MRTDDMYDYMSPEDAMGMILEELSNMEKERYIFRQNKESGEWHIHRVLKNTYGSFSRVTKERVCEDKESESCRPLREEDGAVYRAAEARNKAASDQNSGEETARAKCVSPG